MGVCQLNDTRKKIVVVFGSATPQPGSEEYDNAYAIGKALARAGFEICNGGYGGTMEAAAKGAKDSGGATYGVTASVFKGTANRWIDKEIREQSHIDRLMKLVAFGDAYVILPGGTGTLLELAAVWELMNKGMLQQKPTIIVGSFWESLVKTMNDRLLLEGRDDARTLIRSAKSPSDCVKIFSDAFHRLNQEVR